MGSIDSTCFFHPICISIYATMDKQKSEHLNLIFGGHFTYRPVEFENGAYFLLLDIKSKFILIFSKFFLPYQPLQETGYAMMSHKG